MDDDDDATDGKGNSVPFDAGNGVEKESLGVCDAGGAPECDEEEDCCGIDFGSAADFDFSSSAYAPGGVRDLSLSNFSQFFCNATSEFFPFGRSTPFDTSVSSRNCLFAASELPISMSS